MRSRQDQPSLMRDETIEAHFWEFHDNHPEVYREIVRRARQLKQKGFTHYGIKGIIEVVRWHFATTGPDAAGFKINNNFSSRYARLVEAHEPDLTGFFELRELRAA